MGIVRYLADRIGELGGRLRAGNQIAAVDHETRHGADTRLNEPLLRRPHGLGVALGAGNGLGSFTVKADLLCRLAQNHRV